MMKTNTATVVLAAQGISFALLVFVGLLSLRGLAEVSREENVDVAARYHYRNRSSDFFARSKTNSQPATARPTMRRAR